MFNKLMELYNARKASERILMMCTVYMVLFVCFFFLRNTGKKIEKEMQDKQNKIIELEGILSLEDRIMANLDEVKRNLDERRMIDAQKLQLYIEQCALLSGIDYDISATSDSKLDNFHLFSITLNTKKVQMANLVDFEKMLMDYSPYIRVNTVSISASKSSLSANYKISSFTVQ